MLALMKIALIQQRASGDLEDNRRRGLSAMEQAASDGAQAVCFAELAFDPFWPQIPATADRLEMAETIPGPTTERFQARAAELLRRRLLSACERWMTDNQTRR